MCMSHAPAVNFLLDELCPVCACYVHCYRARPSCTELSKAPPSRQSSRGSGHPRRALRKACGMELLIRHGITLTTHASLRAKQSAFWSFSGMRHELARLCTYWKLVASPSVWASFSTSGTLRTHHLCSPPNPHYHIRSLTAHMSSGKRIPSKVSKQLTPNERSQPGIHSTLSAGRVGKFQTLTRDGNCLQNGVGKNGIRVQERFPPPDRAIGRASW